MISVVIPLYNKEAIVARSIGSVLSQSFADFEVVVVDDGSTDRSAEIVRAFDDPRVRLVSQENGGPSKARNTGTRHANGDWIIYLDADDEMLPDTLEHFHHLSMTHPNVDMFLGEVLMNNGHDMCLHTKYKEGELRNIFRAHAQGRLMQCSGSTMYRRTLCDWYPYNESIRRYEDLECLFRKYKSGRLWLTDKPVASVNCQFASASRGRDDISEDFVGHLDFTSKGFWERMCLYGLFLGERERYGEQTRRLYPSLYHRYDLLLVHKLLGWARRILP